jgi:hypothetical protein
MAKDLSRTLSLRAAYQFGNERGLEQEVRKIRELVVEWTLSYDSTVRRGYIVELFEEKQVFDEFKIMHWQFGNTPEGEGQRNWYINIKNRYEAFLAGRVPESGVDESDESPAADLAQEFHEFAMEAHLRDFLAKNLDRVEAGMRLHTSSERSGVEYPVDGGRIDLLAVDRDGKFVVIELKLSRGRNPALGQLIYYMAWVDQHLGNGPCRGLIIASDITEELSRAVVRVPGVSLAKYRMSFAIEAVPAPASWKHAS